MKILFVNHLKPTTASFLRQLGLGTELMKAGHEVSYIARRPSSNVKLQEKLALAGLAPSNSPQFGNMTYWAEPFEETIPFNILKLTEKCKSFDLIHVNKAYPFTSILLSLPKFLAGKRVVLDWEDWDGIGGYVDIARKSLPSRFALGFFEEEVPKSCDAIIAVSRILATRALDKGISRDRIFYVPNGFDESLFNEKISGERIRSKLSLGNKPMILLLSALHSYEAENFRRIFDCMSYVVKRVPDATLLLVGQGEVREIMRYVESLGITKNVVCTGYIPHQFIPEVIAAVDVAVHILSDNIYFRSSSPMAVPEYMSMGKAIVASDVGELTTMLKDGAGILVKEQSAEAFGSAVLKLLLSPETRNKLGKSALTRAKTNYSYKILVKEAERAYTKALESG